jgi:hypothetical protein
MTIRVTVHHAHGENAPQDWRVEVVRPPKGQVIRNELEDAGHVLEFEVASNTRELAYVWWPAWTEKPEDAEPIVLELAADSDQQEYHRDDPGEGYVPADGDKIDRGDAGGEQPAEASHEYEPGEPQDIVVDLKRRVEGLEKALDEHLTRHPEPTPMPIVGRGPGETPTGFEAAALRAAMTTEKVRDAFQAAALAFGSRLGLEFPGDPTTTLGTTLRRLTDTETSADDAATHYRGLAGTSRRSTALAFASLAGQVHSDGDTYAETVDLVAEEAVRRTDPDEAAAYADLVTALRAEAGPAIAELRQFDVGVGSSVRGRNDRQGVTS